MSASNQRLDGFITEFTAGEIRPLPLTENEDEAASRIWSGDIAEIEAGTFQAYSIDVAGAPKLKDEDWFLFSDSRTTTEPGILFWQRSDHYFARRFDQDQWDKFLKAAKIKKSYW